MKVLHLGGARRVLGQGFFRWRQGPVQRDHQRVFAQDHGHRLGRVAGAFLLESDGRLRDLLCHGRIGFDHLHHLERKKTDVAEDP